MDDHWIFFSWDNIQNEAIQRLKEAQRVGIDYEKFKPEMHTLEYWCAWVAHANLASVIKNGQI